MGFALSLALKKRLRVARKWPITELPLARKIPLVMQAISKRFKPISLSEGKSLHACIKLESTAFKRLMLT